MEISVRRVRVILEPDGTITDALGVELLVEGVTSEIRADGVTDDEWARGRWIPFSEFPGEKRP